MKTAIIRARVTPETIQQLDTIVEQSLGDRSDHIRQAVTEYIWRHQLPTPAATIAPQTAFVDQS